MAGVGPGEANGEAAADGPSPAAAATLVPNFNLANDLLLPLGLGIKLESTVQSSYKRRMESKRWA